MGDLENLARQRIAKWRKQHHVSQERLAQVTQHHQTTVGKWEKGDLSVDIDTIAAWARHFGRTLFDVIAHEDAASAPAEIVAAFNALPTDDLREKVLALMRSLAPPGVARAPQNGPSHGKKRG